MVVENRQSRVFWEHFKNRRADTKTDTKPVKNSIDWLSTFILIPSGKWAFLSRNRGEKRPIPTSAPHPVRLVEISAQELLAMKRIADPVQDLLFSPDGDWLILKTLTGLHLLSAGANPARK
jgi:hypothetical protein